MDEKLARIQELKKQLLDLGYHSFQIDSIDRDIHPKGDLAGLSAEQQQELIETLTEYVAFAHKCRCKSFNK